MATATQPPPVAPSRYGPGRVAAIVAGSLLALLGVALALGGGVLMWAHATQRDDGGYYTSAAESLSTPTAALTAEQLNFGDFDADTPQWVLDAASARVRLTVRAALGEPVFVGIARQADVARFLAGVAHDEVDAIDGGDVDLRRVPGRAAAPAPGAQRFWVASASGSGTRTVDWKAEGGRWAAVVMRTGGTRGVEATVRAGVKTGLLLPIGVGLLVAGVVSLSLGGALVAGGLHRPGGGSAIAAAAPLGAPAAEGPLPGAVPATTPPVSVEARLDEPLHPWLWLVKWALALPHVVCLAFLWAAWIVLTVVAWLAILLTGRYPRGIFEFNLGVLRWTWRVGFYAFTAIGTDRYPPFTLGPAPDYPCTLDVAYPERLSRPKALVKWWLLALPHYLILAAFFGGYAIPWWPGQAAPGVVGVLVVVAGVVLLVKRRYPRDVWRLVIGMHRWLFRVVAYAGLMRDEYPPFRLER